MQVKVNGFSLIELMVSVVILIVLAAIGAPLMMQFMQNSRVSTTAGDFLSMVNLARSEAIRRNTRVSLCALSSDSGTCSTSTASSTVFDLFGWAVFQEATSSGGSSEKGASDSTVLIRQQSILSKGVLIRGDFARVTFTPSGQMLTNATPVGGGSIKVCRANAAGSGCDTNYNVRCILISNSGSPSVMEPTSSASIASGGSAGGCSW